MASRRDPLGQGQGVAAIQVHRIPVSPPLSGLQKSNYEDERSIDASLLGTRRSNGDSGLLLAPTGPLSDVERGLNLECAHVRSSYPSQPPLLEGRYAI